MEELNKLKTKERVYRGTVSGKFAEKNLPTAKKLLFKRRGSNNVIK